VLNNPHQAPPIDKRGEFMKGHPQTFSHTSDPLEADGWLRAVERQLNMAQCNDHQKVLYAYGQLQVTTQDWWKSFEYGRPNNASAITWQEFRANFRSYHIPAGLIELKQDKFRVLKQGSMSVCEYHDMFTQLSCYAPEDVDNDTKKQKCFLKGLNDGLQLRLLTVVYADFQTLVDRAKVIESKRREMEEKKRRMQIQPTVRNTL
jgi:hypothetical protein